MSNWRHMMPTTEAYLLDKVLYQLHHNPDDLADYNRDKPAYLARFSLTPEMASGSRRTYRSPRCVRS